MVDLFGQLSTLSTSAISDALDRLGIPGQVVGIYPLDRRMRLAGRAYTVLYQPVDTDGGTVGDYIDDIPAGSVAVLANGGRVDATVWGDLLTLSASRRAVGGTVIDGACRDIGRALDLEYPLFSRGHWMRTGKDRVKLVAVDVPVEVGQVRVTPGDILVGDSDGVVAVPAARENDVLDAALQIDGAEQAIRREVEADARLDDARRRSGYFGLQTRER